MVKNWGATTELCYIQSHVIRCVIKGLPFYEPRSDRRDLLATKVKSEIFTEKESFGCCEENIFTNNKDMSV